MNDFLNRDVPAFGKRVFRVGLSAGFGIDEAGIRAALDGPINYVFWNPTAFKLRGPLRDALKRDRQRYVVATGPSFGFLGGSVRRRVERALKVLGTEYLDVLQLYWLGKMSALTEGTLSEMVKLREEGKVRALGVSIHDRARAGRLAEDSPLDMLMIRYNAAHPGAERDIFPHLSRRHPAVVAYTATAWRRLLRAPRGWSGRTPEAADCYRFCLTNSHVDVVLMGPSSGAQLRDNLRALEKGPLSDEEMGWMREFGKAVHG
ncbi:MAG: aldo/keto reductase [Myxococcota bacterium]